MIRSPSIYTIEYPELTVPNFIGYPIGPKRSAALLSFAGKGLTSLLSCVLCLFVFCH